MKKFAVIVSLILALGLAGCGNTESSSSQGKVTTTTAAVSTTTQETSQSAVESKQTEGSADTTTTQTQSQGGVDYSSLTAMTVNGAYAEVNGGEPFFSDNEKTLTSAFETYADLDELGRCGTAYANICKELMPVTERESIGTVKPSGWQTSKYDKTIIKDMYLYNRCHLIAFMLAGENANPKNLITGTRYLNIEGMLPFENKVKEYIISNPSNHVLYRVTPVFKGEELVARGVLMEAWSVEDSGKGVKFCVWCPNVQPNIIIDYADGSNRLAISDVPATTTTKATMAETTQVQTQKTTSRTYVLNTKTKKIHYADCKAVKDMKEENKQTSTESIDTLKAQGYTPCGICKP